MKKKKQTHTQAHISFDTTGELTITQKQKETLTKEQIAFNKLIEKVELLNKKIEKEKLKNERILEVFSKTIPILDQKLAEAHYACATSLAGAIQGKKLTAKRNKEIRELIVWLCNDAFTVLPPDPERIAFYDSWSESSYEEEIKEEKRLEMEEITESLKYHFGVDLDLSDIDNSPEGFAQLHERMEKLKEEINDKNASNSKKNKKQINAELKRAKEQSEKLKSLRKIYIDLAKMLHPDLTSNAEDKLIREEMMKQVTTAYNEKDISTLLKLELKWVTKERDTINSLPIDKLNLYIENLKDQTRELENKLYNVSADPRYNEIRELTFFPEKAALQDIKGTSEVLKREISETQGLINILKSDPTKDKVLEIVRNLRNVRNNADFLDDFSQDFFRDL